MGVQQGMHMWCMPTQVDFGDGFKAVGNQPCLGSWDVKAAPSLKWSDGHVWAFTAHVPVGVPVCFKVGFTTHSGWPLNHLV